MACAVLNAVGPEIDSTFSERSLGNRLAKTPRADGQVFADWRQQNFVRHLRVEGFAAHGSQAHYVLTDITRFYDSIRHDRLMAILHDRILDDRVLRLIQQFIEARPSAGAHGSTDRDHRGLPQGPGLSAFLANLYLDSLDAWLEPHCVDFVRYVDDLAILYESAEAANHGLQELAAHLGSVPGLELNPAEGKTRGPFPTDEFEPMRDWLADARYQAVREVRLASELSEHDEAEMRDAFRILSGASLSDDADYERLVRYLGFYIAFSGKLGDAEEQRGVLALATHVLMAQRPKHSAAGAPRPGLPGAA